jgi:hypothetical protein
MWKPRLVEANVGSLVFSHKRDTAHECNSPNLGKMGIGTVATEFGFE